MNRSTSYRAGQLLLAGMLAASLSIPGGQAAAQDLPTLPGQFAYVEDGSRLFLARGSLGEPVLLLQAGEGSTIANPRFSPDGRSLAYCLEEDGAGNPSLHILDLLSADTLTVAQAGSCAFDWSPDGTRLAYAHSGEAAGQQAGLWSYSLEERDAELLLPTGGPVARLRWSPDGGAIGFFEDCPGCVGRFHLYDPASGNPVGWAGAVAEAGPGPDMDWSPDGGFLVFDEGPYLDAPPDAGPGLLVADRDGSRRIRIPSQPGRGAYFPLWSPDGERIAFASVESFTIGNFVNRRSDLMAVAPDGSNARTLYASIYEVFPQAWSPDGRYLLFAEPQSMPGEAHQKHRLVMLDAETGDIPWSAPSSRPVQAVWGPLPATPDEITPAPLAGRQGLLFVSPDYALAFYEPASGQVQKLTAPYSGKQFSVSPDGRTVLFGDRILSLQGGPDGTVSLSALEAPHARSFDSVQWSPDGQRYGFVDEHGAGQVVDLLGKRELLSEGEAPPEFSHDGRWLAYCDGDGRLWIAERGKPADWIVQRDRCSVEWSPTQAILAYITFPAEDPAGTSNGTAFLYDPLSGRTREIAREMSDLAWSADGKLVAVRRISSPGGEGPFSVGVVNPETGAELPLGEFDEGKGGSASWIEQEDGYRFGRFQFQADLLAAQPGDEIVFDATRDGNRLLAGRLDGEQMEVGCLEPEGNAFHPLVEVSPSDLPGLEARFSPDGEWAVVSTTSGDQGAAWLARCQPGTVVRLPVEGRPVEPYFSPDSDWLVIRQAATAGALGPGTYLYQAASGQVREVEAAPASGMTWFQMPEAAAAPEDEAPAAAAQAPSQRNDPIDLQGDEPDPGGRSLLLPILLWGGLLVAFLGLAYFLWKRSLLARVEKLAAPEAEREQEPASPEPVLEPHPAPPAMDLQAAFHRGVESVRAAKAAEGIAELRKVVAAEPDRADAWFWLAIACVREKDYRAAERCFLQARKHGHPEADKALAWLREKGI